MDARDAVMLVEFLERHGLEVYVDGGWAVDALLGEQTRTHADLDIAVPHKYVPRLRELLAVRGYRERPRDDTWECNFVVADACGREIDVHSYTLDDAGVNVHGVAYISEHLTGKGSIHGYPVRCISPEWLVKFHTGYDLDENDFRDVRALCERFGIPLPDEYQK
jgi:lincosamide nucleotidyltransferase A/C/D/E